MIIIAKQINEEGQIDIRELGYKYPKFCVNGTNLLIFVNRIFNEECVVVMTPRIRLEALIVVEDGYPHYKLDLLDIMKKYGIAKNYYVEVVATNFIIKEQKQLVMIPIFYNEIKVDCDYKIKDIIEKEIRYIQNVGETYEIIGKLHYLGLANIACDLQEAICRLEKRDVDGSIKFFRRVIEGFKSWVNEDVVGSPNRAEVVKNYLNKVYHLLSNFGEHAGTEASMNEAVLSKEIVVSVAKYLISKKEE